MTSVTNMKEKFTSHHLEDFAEMNKFDIFWICFLEQFIIDVIIPKMNKNLGTPLTLQEFYIWLGCNFYMACYPGNGDHDEWWSSSPTDMFKSAPFRLNGFISRNRWLEIMQAI
jgi:hypothetical protein